MNRLQKTIFMFVATMLMVFATSGAEQRRKDIKTRQREREENRAVLKRLKELKLVVFDYRVKEPRTGDESIRGYGEFVKCGYPLATRLSALSKISNVRYLVDCALYDVVGFADSITLDVHLRKADDPIRTQAVNQLAKIAEVDDIVGNSAYWGVRSEITGRFNVLNPPYGERPFQVNAKYHDNLDVAQDCVRSATGRAFMILCEVFSKKHQLTEFLLASEKYWIEGVNKYGDKCEPFEPEICECLSDENQDGLLSLFKDYYQFHWPKQSALQEKIYALLSSERKLVAARHAVTFTGKQYEKGGDKNYDWAFEAKMIKDNLKVFIKEFGAESGVELPRKAAINKLSFLLRDDEGREPFEGIFGRKFGETIAVDEKCRVRSFGMNFYRVRFEPEKKSQAFADYYLWVSEVTRKVFAIEARSKSALSDVLVTALEKKYKTRFANSGQYYEMLFPKEACSFKMFKNISYSSSSDGYGAGLFAAMIFNSDFGNSILRQTGDEIEKRKRSVKNYIFTQADRQSGGVAVAESIELFAMAKRESQIAETEREKEAQLRKKLEADNAADAF